MKDYVNRYIYAVTRRLPFELRDEVEAELNAHISDMLSEHPDEEEIDRVLHELGHPRDIACKYDDRKRYVVAPEFYADYQLVLKIGLMAVGIIALFFTALNALLTVNSESVWGAIGYVFESVLNGTFNSIVYAFAIITIVFWVVGNEKVQKNIRPWKMKDLMEVPKDYKVHTYKRGRAIIALVIQVIFSTTFIVILLHYIDLLGIYQNGELVAPFFGVNVIKPYIPYIILSEVFVMLSMAILVVQKRYSVIVVIAYTLGKVATAILSIVIMHSTGFITNEFFQIASQNINMEMADLVNAFDVTIIVFTVLIVMGVLSDISSQWKRLFKPIVSHQKKA